MLATNLNDENILSQKYVSEKVSLSSSLLIQSSIRMSRKHRPAPLDLSPSRRHLSPLDSTDPNALEDYLFSSSPLSSNSNVGMGMPSPAHYSQSDLLNILNSNPPLTPVPPLRTSPKMSLEESVASPGLVPASHSEVSHAMDEIFVELVQTENSFLSEIETIEMIVKEILSPMGVVEGQWVDAVNQLHHLHSEFVRELNVGDRMTITPAALKSILDWPESAQIPYRSYISNFRLGLDSLFSSTADESQISRLQEIKLKIIPEGSEQVTLDYLFKRPLVRLRYYSKLYKYWTHFPPQIVDGDVVTSSDASVKEKLSAGHEMFKVLVSTARGRVSEEKYRLQNAIQTKILPSAPIIESLSSLLNGIDCSRCKDLANSNKSFSLTNFLNSNPGNPVFVKEVILSLPDQSQLSSQLIILPKHLILLGLSSDSNKIRKWLIFPPISGDSIIPSSVGSSIEMILGDGIKVYFNWDSDLENALRELRLRATTDSAGELLTSPPLGVMRRSPAMGTISKPSADTPGLTEQVNNIDLNRTWSFERSQGETQQVPAEVNEGRTREDSVNLVRGVLQMSPTPSPTSPSESTEIEPIQSLPPPKMAPLKRDHSPTRKPVRSKPEELFNSIDSPRLPRSPSLPKESLPWSTQKDQLPPAPRSPQRSISPSRSVPVQLSDLPHFPSTPTKHDVPTLPALEFGQSPLGMRNYLNRTSASPRKGQIESSPLSKERYSRGTQHLSTSPLPHSISSPQVPHSLSSPTVSQLSPIPDGRVSPERRFPSHLSTSPSLPQSLSPAPDGRVSPSPTVCTFPPRTMRLESERLATRSVEDLRRLSSPRQGALSRLDHRSSGSSGSTSVEDEELSSHLFPTGRIVHSGHCTLYFWKKGGWHRPEDSESIITIEQFGKRGNARVLLRIMDCGSGNILFQYEILATASIRRDSPCEVSIGIDIPNGKKEYYLFAVNDPGEADTLFHALNTARSFVGGVSEEQLRQATSLFARTTSFASSLATNSSVGSTISNLSLYDTPPLPSIPAEYSPVEDPLPPLPPLQERLLIREQKVKIFLRQDAGIWKNLGNGKVSVFTTGPEVRVLVIQPTKKDPNAVLVNGRIFESGACERVGRTGVAVNLPSREGKISVYMLQSKEAQIIFEAIKRGKCFV